MALTKVEQAEKDELAKERKRVLSASAAMEFRRANPDYYPWDINGVALQKYVTDHNLDSTLVSSWQRAYDTLLLQGKIEPAESAEIKQPEEAKVVVVPRVGFLNGTPVREHNAAELADLKAMSKTKEGFAALQKQVRAENSAYKIHAERHGINYDAKQ
jgi:hypothetical protein